METAAAVTGDATLRRVTAASIGSDTASVVEHAVAQGRAADRYHINRVCSRKIPVVPGSFVDIHREYSVYLANGAMIMLTIAKDKDGGDQGIPTVHVVHMFHYCRPGLTAAELSGDADLRGPVQLEWYDRQRPAAAIRHLAARVLGPLPPDLVDSLLPKPLSSGGDAAALASYAFAAWLGGLPLEPPGVSSAPSPPSAAAAQSVAAPSSAAPATKWLSGLQSLWNRVLGTKQHSKPTVTDTTAAASEGGQPAAAAPAAAAASPAAPAAGSSTGAKRLTIEEAWAEFEQRAVEREVPVYGNDVERAWFEEVLHLKEGPKA